MSSDQKQKRITPAIRGRVAVGAVAASLAVAVAVPALGVANGSGIEFDVVGAADVDGKTYVADRESYVARVTVPADLAFNADKSIVFAEGVEGEDVDVWEDKTPEDAEEGDPKVYETMISRAEVMAGAEASVIVSKDGSERPSEVISLPAAQIDSGKPAISIKMSEACAGQVAVEGEPAGKVDYYAVKGLKAEVTVEDVTFDASATKVNGQVLAGDQWVSDGDKHTATVDCSDIDDLEVSSSDKVGNASSAEYGSMGSTVDADGAVVDGDSFSVDASVPQTTIELNGDSSHGYFNTSTVDVKITVSACDNYTGSQIKVNGVVQDDWRRTDLEDGSHVYEKTLFDEGSYEIAVINNKTWGTVPGVNPERELVIDRTDPEVSVSWSEDEPSHNKYYRFARTAIVTVTDTNFDAEASKIDALGAAVGEWQTDASDPSKHTATVMFFWDGIRNLKVSASDLAGNATTPYDSGEFIVDRTAPRIQVQWDNNSVENDKYYGGVRTATITVTEANYDQSLVKIEGGAVEWDADDPKKATVAFEEDGAYELKVSASDLAGNAADPYDSGEFVMDSTAPVVDVTWDNVAAKGSKDGKAYYDAARTATITIDEENYDQKLVSVDAPGASSIAWDADDPKKCVVTFEADGEYRLQIDAADLAGNDAARIDSGTFVVDAVAPQATVTYDLNEPVNEKYFSAERTATIEVVEANFDGDLVSIAANGDEGSYEVSEWAHDGERHTATVKFKNSDKAFALKIAGADLAQHAIEFGKDKDGKVATSYASGEFYVDTVSPAVQVTRDKTPTNSYSGVDYYNEAVTITVQVTDDHFDTARSTINAKGAQSESGWEQSADDPHVWTKTAVFTEGTDRSISVDVRDLAGSMPDPATPGLAYGPFIVDMTAPEVASASVSTTPVNNYSTSYYFYNRAASASIELSDNISLEAISIADAGDGYYGQDVLVSADAIIGSATATATLTFADGHEFDRDVVVRTSDLAKNERYWSISPTGTIRVLTEREVENLSVFNPDKVYPEGLLKDTVAPRLSLSGVEEGQYYNTPQTVSLTVDELNYPYLQSYEPDQAVFTVAKHAGDAGRAQSSWARSVSYLGISAREGLSFTDDHGASYTYDQFGMSETFVEDGHYVIDAQVTDPSKNQGTAYLAEFTIDQTAPTVQIDFDNNDVRNGKYYKASRTATVTVTEHNFDASLINIETTGSVSGWSDNGDVHTATVTFAVDGVHNLAVSGKDKANNEMVPYKADEFVVDLTAPTVTITGVEDSHAYKDEVMPIISFADEANFDPAGTTYTLAGTKNGEVSYDASVFEDALGSTVCYSDFASESAVDDIYTLTAHLTDLAGNEADAALTFSVNRFGSTFRVIDADTYKQNNGYLTQSRGVMVEEINVSGVASEEHGVSVTQGVNTRELARTEAASASGFAIDEGTSEAEDSNGWAVYIYNIPAGNFSTDGRYHVSVHSNDLAENINTSSDYFDRDAGGESAAEVDFILDTTDPVITNLSIHDGDVIESNVYVGSFKVVENIGVSDVKVFVDGKEEQSKGDVYGNYNFSVDQASFTDREIRVVATDLAGRTGEAEAKGFHVTTDILELHLVWVIGGVAAAAAALGGIIFVLVKRKKEESEQ
ncbi:Ig-like domain-containing protein [Paratractidigestivibacter sp.]|uniref:Ig-like domain-containing protein n=1 Tax=Paratractidigestivibacter sp. TaxID=2847316 RepID=UPI002AC93CF6|nr:Ig-like domain-containing protein [Paratractidigestivibacter sp.]